VEKAFQMKDNQRWTWEEFLPVGVENQGDIVDSGDSIFDQEARMRNKGCADAQQLFSPERGP
jgi:hypothetical protein